jgi:YD repeat-containing protein
LGNRDSVIVRDGNNVNYDIDNLSNRYESVGGNTLAYDAAGNLTTDKDGYQYEYDYENRITKITKDSNDIAEFAYDALGRRIKMKDSITPPTRGDTTITTTGRSLARPTLQCLCLPA